ncbi:MAG: regulatory protein RecX [Thermoleophilia bacterium]|nr:regulatory protein RecX [Thermoleophilia bacterium]
MAKRGRSDRVTVYLEGKAAFDLAAAVADRASLHVGDVLTVEQQERLAQADAPYRAREKAVGLLAIRERARREIEIRLQRAGFEPDIVGDTVAWLEGLGYLDEQRFTERYAAEKLTQGWGQRRVRAELLRKGVERRVVDETLDARAGAEGDVGEELEAVAALARKRFGREFAVDPETASRRLAGFMARRGYDWDAVRSVTRTLVSEAGAVEAAVDAEGVQTDQDPAGDHPSFP